MNGVILARVSSKEQEEGYSIEAQLARLQEYCKRHKINVLETFTVIESSTRGCRKQFMAALDFCKKQKGTVALVADAVDRVQRSFKESIMLNDLVQKNRIELHFYREGMVIGQNASSADLIRWDFSVIGAKQYVLALSENVRRSMEYKRKNGEWGGNAPIGYINTRNDKGKAWVDLDPERAPLVRKMFEEYATGAFSLDQMVAIVTEWGLTTKRKLPLSKAHIHRILQNPFYYGQMVIKGESYYHSYPAIISEEIFRLCNSVRKRCDKRPFVYAGKEFLFRGMITCANTGKTVTTERHKGHHYLAHYDTKGKRHYIREEKAIEAVSEVFGGISISEATLRLLHADMKGLLEVETKFHRDSLHRLNEEADKLVERQKRLVDLYLDGKIEEDIYQEHLIDIKQKLSGVRDRIAGHDAGDSRFIDTMTEILRIANDIKGLWEKSSDIAKKRKLLKFMIRTMMIKDGEVQITLNTPFNLFDQNLSCSKWRCRRK